MEQLTDIEVKPEENQIKQVHEEFSSIRKAHVVIVKDFVDRQDTAARSICFGRWIFFAEKERSLVVKQNCLGFSGIQAKIMLIELLEQIVVDLQMKIGLGQRNEFGGKIECVSELLLELIYEQR